MEEADRSILSNSALSSMDMPLVWHMLMSLEPLLSAYFFTWLISCFAPSGKPGTSPSAAFLAAPSASMSKGNSPSQP